MKWTDLLGTTAFRLALLYSLLFGVLAALVFALVYRVNTAFIETQTVQRLRSESDALLERYDQRGIEGLSEAVRVRSNVAGLVNMHYLLMGPQGEHLAGNLLEWPHDINWNLEPPRFRRSVHQPSAGALDWDQDEYYDVATRVVSFDEGHRLLIGIGQYEFAELREQSLAGLALGSAITILLAILIGVVLGRAVLGRVAGIDSALADIMAGNLARRISAGERPDEFRRLAERINGMLDRIEELVRSLRQVTNNVSHDLRTPLHRLRGRLEHLLLSADESDEAQRLVESGIHDIDEILATFNDLLAIAEAEAGYQAASFEDVDLTRLTDDVAELYAAAAEDRALEFTCRTEAGVHARGKASLLSQALSNLIENAMKYTPPGGRVEVELQARQDGFDLLVTDTGPGIPPTEFERVTRPFERLDTARSAAGSGLGLSVVSAIAKLHGARLVLADNAPGLRAQLQFTKTADPPTTLPSPTVGAIS